HDRLAPGPEADAHRPPPPPSSRQAARRPLPGMRLPDGRPARESVPRVWAGLHARRTAGATELRPTRRADSAHRADPRRATHSAIRAAPASTHAPRRRSGEAALAAGFAGFPMGTDGSDGASPSQYARPTTPARSPRSLAFAPP